jgi:hypothetical protein
MQTFMPLPNYRETACILDNKRLGKQRVEAKQILIALNVDVGPHQGNPQSGWRHHPCLKLWKGFEKELVSYAIAICSEWRSRKFKDILLDQFMETYYQLPDCPVPSFLGNELFHRSHQSNLLRKLPSHYGQYFQITNDLPYYWPL